MITVYFTTLFTFAQVLQILFNDGTKNRMNGSCSLPDIDERFHFCSFVVFVWNKSTCSSCVMWLSIGSMVKHISKCPFLKRSEDLKRTWEDHINSRSNRLKTGVWIYYRAAAWLCVCVFVFHFLSSKQVCRCLTAVHSVTCSRPMNTHSKDIQYRGVSSSIGTCVPGVHYYWN